MAKDNRSFFERLTGTVRMDEETEMPVSKKATSSKSDALPNVWNDEESEEEGELTVDVYQTPDSIVIKSMIAGVRPEDLDVSITRDTVSIRGHREEEKMAKEDDYFARELYWGSFSRTIQLPEEIDVDEAEAVEKHGLLILKLPKLDKKRHSKLKVKTA
ncbi:MAG TPA: Hsp20/alpha crystallin family protein [Candidatus Paceibacterota bacterium]|jgi:HSP20 family protein|nr:Hsp20/alpha crystallin family protein [Candidatus Paceibacterota bacterium]